MFLEKLNLIMQICVYASMLIATGIWWMLFKRIIKSYIELNQRIDYLTVRVHQMERNCHDQ